ncbi:uncharacterized protein H6S33_005310 [Morchella sextelata]|uniref:uncharacterized protein n=1 Tax=Morchella sextelata TaxID=1174677 RepID=UPI001D0471CD|nr:uncharacterized protein H6S33_005310 [Morchella sextelata]KAH0613424.1 hypothetical protein H6S33_005310 [Morchella sextelata]
MCSWVTGLLSNIRHKVGLGSPVSTPVRKGQEVWLLDNTAFRSPTNPHQWHAEFVAAYFSEDSGKDISLVVADIVEKLGIAGKGDAEAERRIAERVEPFLNLILAAKTVEVDFAGGQGRLRLGPAAGHGISVNELPLPGRGWVDDQVVESRAVLVEGGESMRTAFADPEGWGVISDIDDTIKVSEVRDRLALLRHTFAELPEAVPGMPQLYQHIQTALGKPVWFYLSASPYNLYPMLRSFTSDYYPRGQLILREMSWMELESFIVSLTVGTQKYKEERMRTVMKWLPMRKWVLIGDSTQTDPEAYASLYKLHPDKVRAIFIRRVQGVNEAREKDLNSDKRFEKAFKGIPKNAWRVFNDPAELNEAVNALTST